MEIGKLNQRIILEKPHVVLDEIGNHKNKWIAYYKCWSYVTVYSSSEDTQAGVMSDTQKLTFYIRENNSTRNMITTSHRINFRGDFYNIDSVEYDFNQKDYIKLVGECSKKGDDFRCQTIQ